VIEYIAGHEPVPRDEWEAATGRPSVQARIWREGDAGWVADNIEAAWSRWLLAYPAEWRTVGQAIPYVHLKSELMCDRPKDAMDHKIDDLEFFAHQNAHADAISAWEQAGEVGPMPEWPGPSVLGHTHSHDHGICIDPWLVDHATDHLSVEATLKHELAHAIAGTFSHEGDWFWMCEISGYELRPDEKQEYEWQAWADRDP
jgi:hypothetical protein